MEKEKIYVAIVCDSWESEWDNLGVYNNLKEAKNECEHSCSVCDWDTYYIYEYEKEDNKYNYINSYNRVDLENLC